MIIERFYSQGNRIKAFFRTGYLPGFGVISAELFPTRNRAMAQGLTHKLGSVASVVAPFVVGELGETYGLLSRPDVVVLAVLVDSILAVVRAGIPRSGSWISSFKSEKRKPLPHCGPAGRNHTKT